MIKASIASSLTIGFLSVSSLAAAVIPGRWEKVADLQVGTPVVVELKSGDRAKAVIKHVGTQEITITDSEGAERQLPKEAVARIVTSGKVKDGLANGMLIGMGIGTGAAVAAVAIATGGVSEECTVCGLAIFFGFASGWATGTAIDAIHQGPAVLYQAQSDPP